MLNELVGKTICDYIKLAEKEIFEIMKNDLEEKEISLEGAECIHYCLENIKHLEMMKAKMLHHSENTNSPVVYSEKDTDIHTTDVDIHSHKSYFGG